MAPMIERDGIVVCHCGSDVPSFMSDEYAVKLEAWFVGEVTFCNGWNVMAIGILGL